MIVKVDYHSTILIIAQRSIITPPTTQIIQILFSIRMGYPAIIILTYMLLLANQPILI
jgi:hypothetical protein